MILAEITIFLESWAPPSIQESYDNSGLLTGNLEMDITRAILTLDCTEAVLDEAIALKANLIICHHPPFFTAMKRFTGSGMSQRILIKAIKNDLAIYAAHTNLDHATDGVSSFIADKLGLVNQQILQPLKGNMKKIVCYCPPAQCKEVLEAMLAAGAGTIGDYRDVSFLTTGTQTFMPLTGANPFSGTIGLRHTGDEQKIECIYGAWLEKGIIRAMLASHPYEVVAHEITTLDNEIIDKGAGIVAEFETALSPAQFLKLLSVNMKAEGIRYTSYDKPIRRVGCCGGSGSFLLEKAIAENCDAFVTADFKYHQFFEAEQRLMIADIGHFESEQFTSELLFIKLSQKFPNFELLLSKVHTNPIFYYNGNNC